MIGRKTVRIRSILAAAMIGAGLLHSLYYMMGMLGGWEKDGWNLFMTAAGIGLVLIGGIVWRWREVRFSGRGLVLVRIFRVGFIAGLVLFLAGELWIWQEGRSTEPRKSDLVLILGARVRGETVSLSLKERLDQGLAYLKLYPDTPVLLSGGQGPGEDVAEAEAMKRYLVDHGVPESQLMLENKSRDTFENMKYSRDLLSSRGIMPDSVNVTLITNDFHMLRSKMLANRVGLQVHGYPSATPPYTLPRMLTREFAALIKSWMFDR